MYDIKKFDDCKKVFPRMSKASQKSYGVYVLYCLNQRRILGYNMEFGVFKGRSINMMAGFKPDDKFWGFDSFEGLPEVWKVSDVDIRPTGFFNTEMPKVRKNVRLVKGFFDKSLPPWVEDHDGQISLLHIDSDIYSAAKIIFDLLNDRIMKGTIIMFDELGDWSKQNVYQYWEEGEWKAFNEWLDIYNRDVEVIARTDKYQAAVRVVK